MMSTAHLQQFPHGGMNGSEDLRGGVGRPNMPPQMGSPLLAGQTVDGKKKRFWPLKQKKSAIDLSLTLEEAAKQVWASQLPKEELAAVPAKTPVSILQELLSRRGTTPNYELVQIEGAIHEPTFRYRVTVGDFVALGFGRSKKEAKHAAAKNVLDKIVGNPVSDEGPAIPDDATPIPASAFVADKRSGNPIGTLQELCMSRRWPPPLYGLNTEEGLPHEREFTITCTVYKHKETGTGKSKKLAKREAAHKMWERLQEQTNPPTDDEALEPEAAIARYANLKTSKISTLTPPQTHKVAAFHKNLKKCTGPKLEKLQLESMSDAGFNYVQFLQEIAAEQHFEVTYVDVDETSKSGKYQCLVQLSSMPVAVCYGCGNTSKDAQSAAAYYALEYLKIMTRK